MSTQLKPHAASRPASPQGPSGPINTTIGAVALFGALEETQNCYHALEPLFKGAHSVLGIALNFEKLDQLQQAGAFLYSGLKFLSAGGLIWATFQIIRHHYVRAQHHVSHFRAVKRPKTRNSCREISLATKAADDDPSVKADAGGRSEAKHRVRLPNGH